MGRKRLAMIIDQQPDARRDLEAMLESAGLVVVADAGYGEEASAVAAPTVSATAARAYNPCRRRPSTA